MKIPKYMVIKLEQTDKETVTATDITDRCEIIEYEADRKIEPLDKDINVRSKTEPQTADCPFDDKIPCEWVCTEYANCKYKPKTEPQTECEVTDCDYHDYCKRRGQTDCGWK